MPRPRKASDEQLKRLQEIAEVRWSTPSNKELAFEMHIAERTVEFYITKFMRELAVSRGTFGDKIAS